MLEPQLYCVSQGQPPTVTLSISQVGKLRLREPKPQATQLPGGRRGLWLCSLMLLGGHSPLSPELAEEGSVFLLTVGSGMVPVGLAPGTP